LADAYCTVSDLSLAIRADALENIEETVLNDCIASASETIDSYLRSRFALPLTDWGRDITRCCAILSVYDAMIARGLNPANAGDDQLEARYEQQLGWLRDIANNRATPNVTDSSGTPEDGSSATRATVDTNESRGWQASYPHGSCSLPFQGRRR
jgi:phage gp36-like protein